MNVGVDPFRRFYGGLTGPYDDDSVTPQPDCMKHPFADMT
jgi:hypothetical protein